MAFPSAIYLDRDADGHGWFVDATPGANEEFDHAGNALSNGPAAGRMDLLTVLAHELGHALGLEDLLGESDDLMAEALAAGVRRSPLDAVDSIFGGEGW